MARSQVRKALDNLAEKIIRERSDQTNDPLPELPDLDPAVYLKFVLIQALYRAEEGSGVETGTWKGPLDLLQIAAIIDELGGMLETGKDNLGNHIGKYNLTEEMLKLVERDIRKEREG
ncbi:MAG: hypothetical protein UW86_C0003G0005 [Microgenomates group bacterium GW2011_GWA1_Microgenomates_45_10]|nr:MAG: hypothetical protein UW69_C0027G0005 [Microgenomates group bacterium GW2011_GWA2_44_7]KKT77637.1 MAG: hypothetical protein UW73_C0015G0005 [Microgenomates group bacterium GW2011_GWB1_44_8]KKT87360.1 MAG: hypothetical protein UW86_C0003G0005 [Microgenomates group bacterium GW2011_GWA1_Microgenomates_45_10]